MAAKLVGIRGLLDGVVCPWTNGLRRLVVFHRMTCHCQLRASPIGTAFSKRPLDASSSMTAIVAVPHLLTIAPLLANR